MKFHLWRRPGRCGSRRQTNATSDLSNDQADIVDLDAWLAIVESETDPVQWPDDGLAGVGEGSGDGICDDRPLGDRLLDVLYDDEASLVPSPAAHLSQDQWNALPPAEREYFLWRSRRRIDPRLIPRVTRRTKLLNRIVRST